MHSKYIRRSIIMHDFKFPLGDNLIFCICIERINKESGMKKRLYF